MTIRGFGGGGDYDGDRYPEFDEVSFLIRFLLGVLAVLIVVLLVTFVFRDAARGGCSLPPAEPMHTRRDAICAALGRQPGCLMKARTMAARIESDETDYTVYVGDEWVGTWPIANGEPIDPTLLTAELVSYHLRFQMGDAELQARLKHLYRCRRVAFVDSILDYSLGTTHVLIACAS